MTDVCAPGLIAGQMIGRWGNFFNGEAYGAVTTAEKLKDLHIPDFIINGMKINGVYYEPVFLYESLWNLIGLILLLVLRRLKFIKEGQITGVYLVWYSAGRFVIESLRQDSLMIGNFKVAQIASILLGLTGLVLIWFRVRAGKFKYRYNDEEMIQVSVEE